MKHDTETLRETLRETLLDIHRGNRVELANIPLSAAWPTISRMFEALSFSNSDRRSDAVERAVDDLTRLIGECRQRVHRCEALIAAEERAEAAEEEAREHKRLALVG